MEPNAWQDNPRVLAMLERVRSVVSQPPPRRVPREVARLARSPIAVFLMVFEFVALVVFALMLVLVANTPALTLLFVIMMAVPLAMVLIAGYSLIATRNILANGRLYRGRVVRVKPLPAKINGRWFFSVAVEFEGPGGAKLTGKDTIDNWCSEYFLDARDRGQEVEVLYAPNPMGKVLLPMKMALGNRYD